MIKIRTQMTQMIMICYDLEQNETLMDMINYDD